jgi:DNA polymerase-3 subunit gamma/tau
LVKAATPELEPSVKALLARIARLESHPPAPASPSATKSPERAETAAGRAARGRTAVAITAQVSDQPPVQVTATLPGAGPVDQQIVDDAAASVARELATEADPAPAVTAVATVEPEAPPTATLELSLDNFGSLWPAVKDELRERSPMLAAALDEAAPAALADGSLTLAWPEASGFLKRKAEDPQSSDLLSKAIRSVTGSSLRLAYELRAAAEIAPVVAVPALSDDDLVQRFKDEFDAEELPPDPEEQT